MSVTVNKTRLPGSVIKTASGAVVSVSDARMRGAIGVEASFEPKQDLHGYANPWVGGAGYNKLNLNRPNVIDTYGKGGPSGNTNPRQFSENQVWIGITVNNYFVPDRNIESYSINPETGSVTVTSKQAGYGIGFPLKVSPGESFYVKSDNLYAWGFGFYDADGNFLSYNGAFIDGRVITTPANTSWMVMVLRPNANVESTYTYLRINSPFSQTAYTPYENICPISGITSASAWADPQYAGLVDWNQHIQNGNFADGITGWATTNSIVSVSDGVASMVGTAVSSGAVLVKSMPIKGHTYLASCEIKKSDASQIVNLDLRFTVLKTITSANTTEWQIVRGIVSGSEFSSGYIRIIESINGTRGTTLIKNVQLFDLTQMFGAGNEPDSVDEFKSLFPKTYYDYDLGGTLKTVTAVNGDPHNLTVQLGEERFGGSYDFVRGKLTLVNGYVNLSALSWTNGSWGGVTGWYTKAPSDIKPATNSVAFSGMSSHYRTIRFNASSQNYGAISLRDTGYFYVYYADSPTGQLVYELKDPVVIDMTPAEFELFHRQNYVWTDVGDTTLTYAAISEHGG